MSKCPDCGAEMIPGFMPLTFYCPNECDLKKTSKPGDYTTAGTFDPEKFEYECAGCGHKVIKEKHWDHPYGGVCPKCEKHWLKYDVGNGEDVVMWTCPVCAFRLPSTNKLTWNCPYCNSEMECVPNI